ncbi:MULTISPECIES: ABC transporter substrate-binding protein [Caballeronia]|jgi:sulfonate transport system substrate-binding protein|uniref:Nitrate ABC transporter substrate-binding protein n=1 Tax=Caballeronia zhejiangensis TaxID=871203 RepID=A0A656QSV9_9BURK|nr:MULTISPECIES: ABC transporter substrate-binding protein [Caballeronia]EKS71353.1 nitrate/sulfonate/bicarbonate ABC transporter periplasmic ligand-binding protein [Burkholderia sp. SJ98]MDR5798370.1 ABC transporter substrate-binding protein [Caballeronia sp. LZ008]KDR32029.1 nitrate ABC transporter substrate-binding protein [Caballeronia zhejiangensis]MCG7404063.1 ABC transporter substrate-binding protein [Caballeronia zhejiangensis]MCI1045368.1 ABC transporter substrate-binding protein [Cab
MRIRKRFIAFFVTSFVAGSSASFAQGEPLTLTIGTQDAAWPLIVEASHVLDGAPYKVKWAVLTGPAAQLSALYSKVLDVGLMGDTSLIIEQGNARTPWTADTAPLQIIAGWRNPDSSYPPIVTVVRKSADVKDLADLKGKTWGYNFGGFNYLQYVLSYVKAGLKPKDFEAVKFGDGNVSASAFNAGQVAVYSGGYGPVKETVDKGDARVIIRSDELDIPALSVFTARTDVLRDPKKSEALGDFLGRLKNSWTWWAQNVPAVEKIYLEKMKQSPARAKFSAENGRSRFYPLDKELVAREQKIADTLYKSGDIKNQIKVDVEFNPVFDRQAVASH